MMNRYVFNSGSTNYFTKGKIYTEISTQGFTTTLMSEKDPSSVTNDVLENKFTLIIEEPVMTKRKEMLKGKREFPTGANRNSDDGKLDYEAFLSPRVLEEFGKYMHEHRKLEDGSLRDGDNWQKGIPENVYMKSMWRHFHAVWSNVRGIKTKESQVENLCAMMFNVMGMLHEELKKND